MLCNIYRSDRTDELYLFVPATRGTEDVPDALMQQFQKRQKVMTLNISEQQKLARVDARQVLQALNEQGYFLQMPPQKTSLGTEIDKLNNKLPR